MRVLREQETVDLRAAALFYFPIDVTMHPEAARRITQMRDV
jgi:hypothetical protein